LFEAQRRVRRPNGCEPCKGKEAQRSREQNSVSAIAMGRNWGRTKSTH